jgi:hypothetical protein
LTNVVPFNSSGDTALSLIVFEDARRAIADAKTVEQVNKILALTTGLAAAARQATDREMEAEAAVLKLEAERRLGQLMAAQKATIGFNKGGGDQRSDHRNSKKPGDPPTLAEAGIDKNLADKARKAAAMPETVFEEAKEAKRTAVLTRKSNGSEQSKPRKRKSRFDAEHYAHVLSTQIQLLAELPEEYPEGFGSVLDRLLSDADSIDSLARLARHPKIGAILATVVTKVGDDSSEPLIKAPINVEPGAKPASMVTIPVQADTLGSAIQSEWRKAIRAFEVLTSHTPAQVATAISSADVPLVTEIANYFEKLVELTTRSTGNDEAPTAGADPHSANLDIPDFLRRLPETGGVS